MAMSRWQRLRTFLHLFVVGVRRRMVIGSRAVLLDGERVLLVRHTYVPGWHFPGGGVEPGETAEESAAREAEEETGYRVTGRMRLVGIYLQVHEATNRDHIVVYMSRSFAETRPFRPNSEIAQLRWFPLDALPADIERGTAQRIAEIVRGETELPARW